MAARLLDLLLAFSVALLLTTQCISDRSFQPDLETNYRYVTPSRSLPCNGSEPCQTLDEYASDPAYFVSDSIFYFYPGNHQLHTSLELCDVHHLYFQAMNDGIVSITFEELVTITWINCIEISLSAINFHVTENFTHLLIFENTSAVNLLNIAIISNMNRVGCSAVLIKDSDVNLVNSRFVGISGLYGAALAVSRSNVTFSGNTTLMYNLGYIGGAIFSINSSLIFTGNNTFVNNTVPYDENADPDTALCNYPNTTMAAMFSGTGGAVASLCSLLTLGDNSTFIRNYAGAWGGAIFTGSLDWADAESEVNNCSFLKISGNSTFAKNQAYFIGGAIITADSSLIFEGLVNFVNNSVILYGGALAIFGSSEVRFLVERLSFSNNSGAYGGALSIQDASVFFDSTNESQNSTEFCGNSAELGSGGAIGCDGCTLSIKSNAIFIGNTADQGGAISFVNDGAELMVYPDYTLYFIRNHADTAGGALEVDDPYACYFSPECFISFATASSNSIENVSLVFVNNSAGQEGSVLYGGELNKCILYYSGNDTNCNKQVYSKNAAETFLNNISHIISKGNVSDISSTTVRICLCDENNVPNCSVNGFRVPNDLFPGQLFNVTLVGLGQGNHSMPSRILSQFIDDESLSVTITPAVQSINSTCTTVTYRAYLSYSDADARNIYISFNLYHDNPCQSLVEGVQVQLNFIPCPPGFVLRGQKCDCDRWLQTFTQNCYIDNLSVEHTKNNFWISLDSNRTGLFFTRFGCPLDFCKIPPTNVTLYNPNSQSLCDFNRSGVLCGSCMDSLSLALGSLHCIACSNLYILLIVPFALAGVALVAIILLLRLTVDVGTINGLLFYANIIQANHQAFFPRSINFFTIFISWLNLDLGIETCFYDGLTFYEYSWLQFLFPFYIWLLITLIIVVSHYSLTVAEYLGNFNPVAVLATLFLMSYGKILQAIITPLSWGYLTHVDPTEHHLAIWLYDGNIGFFTEQGHIVLAVFAILTLLCLFLPYTFILLCGHYLQACSHRIRLFSWINKIKPFLDAYHAPYRSNGRYWTGLLLVTRGGLFVIFAVNAVGSDSFNILAICSVATALLALKRQVYESCYIDAVESSFLLNLSVLSVATIYIRENGLGNASQAILSGLSVGIAFVTFLGIFLFHIICQLKRMKIFKEGMLFFRATKRPFVNERGASADQLKIEHELISSTAQLREPLLETKCTTVNNYGT